MTQRETARVLVAENRWSLQGAGTTRKGVRMALLSQGTPGLAPNRDRCDAPPRRVLPPVELNILLKFYNSLYKKEY